MSLIFERLDEFREGAFLPSPFLPTIKAEEGSQEDSSTKISARKKVV
jgi:hypothetical protein